MEKIEMCDLQNQKLISKIEYMKKEYINDK